MRFRISIEKHSKFPQALSGGGSVGIIQTCPASLPAWAVRSWQVAGMQNPTNHIMLTFHFSKCKILTNKIGARMAKKQRSIEAKWHKCPYNKPQLINSINIKRMS